jgi:hypothetical protein
MQDRTWRGGYGFNPPLHPYICSVYGFGITYGNNKYRINLMCRLEETIKYFNDIM